MTASVWRSVPRRRRCLPELRGREKMFLKKCNLPAPPAGSPDNAHGCGVAFGNQRTGVRGAAAGRGPDVFAGTAGFMGSCRPREAHPAGGRFPAGSGLAGRREGDGVASWGELGSTGRRPRKVVRPVGRRRRRETVPVVQGTEGKGGGRRPGEGVRPSPCSPPKG